VFPPVGVNVLDPASTMPATELLSPRLVMPVRLGIFQETGVIDSGYSCGIRYSGSGILETEMSRLRST